MASGFLILRDGRCLSVRHAVHDAVLRSVAGALKPASPLYEWLATQVPAEGDADLGFAFVRAVDEEHVPRTLDIRGLTETNRRLFEQVARDAKAIPAPRSPVEDVESALSLLRQMLDACDAGRPVLELSDWTVEAAPCEEMVGPGWDTVDG
jgi:hypothetical protein